MALSGQDVLNAVNKMPLGHKVGVVAGFVILLSTVNWYFFIDPMQTQITQRQGQLRALEDELIQKQSIANNLALNVLRGRKRKPTVPLPAQDSGPLGPRPAEQQGQYGAGRAADPALHSFSGAGFHSLLLGRKGRSRSPGLER